MLPRFEQSDAALRTRLEAYYDAVPRPQSRVEDFGSLSLFVREGGGLPYYGRPTLDRPAPVAADDVDALLARQRELGLPQSLEWVEETTPSLTAAAHAAGLLVHRHPLMVYELDETPADASAAALVARVVDADDPALPSAIASAHLAFAEPGTALGRAGRDELIGQVAELDGGGWLSTLAARIRAGDCVLVAAIEDGLAVSSGQHYPVGPTTEIVGVGTLPSARRRGLGRAVTTVLAAHAHAHGIETIFLSAGDDDVARMYGRIGFRRVGTALIAEAAPSSVRLS